MRGNQQFSHCAGILGNLCRPPSPASPELPVRAAARGQLCGAPRRQEKEIIMESSMLEETFMIIKSNHQPSPASVTPKPH